MITRKSIENWLYSTIRIEVESGSGTGFLVSLEKEIYGLKKDKIFLVSNKHVVNFDEGMIPIWENDGTSPKKEKFIKIKITNFKEKWIFHPDENIDIAILPMNNLLDQCHKMGFGEFLRMFPASFVIEDVYLGQNITPIEEIIFMGYPIGIWDEYNMVPIVRRGLTATPIYMNFRGYPLFLIDASVFPGSSGSPVILIKDKTYLLGIISESFIDSNFYRLEKVKKMKGIQVKNFVDLGLVFKSHLFVNLMKDNIDKEIECDDSIKISSSK